VRKATSHPKSKSLWLMYGASQTKDLNSTPD
jgi:hypothetical protein